MNGVAQAYTYEYCSRADPLCCYLHAGTRTSYTLNACHIVVGVALFSFLSLALSGNGIPSECNIVYRLLPLYRLLFILRSNRLHCRSVRIDSAQRTNTIVERLPNISISMISKSKSWPLNVLASGRQPASHQQYKHMLWSLVKGEEKF